MFDTSKILSFLEKENLTVEELFIVTLCNEDYDNFKNYLAFSLPFNRGAILLELLLSKELLVYDSDVAYVLTTKAKEMLSIKDNMISMDDFVEAFRNIFPSGVRTAGYLVKGDKNGCKRKLTKFLKENKVTQEEILEATRRYVNRSKLQNYEKLQLAHNFIEKNGISTLAGELEALLNPSFPAYVIQKDYTNEI